MNDNTQSDLPPSFPNYPKPQGLDLAHPQQVKPLMKMMRSLLKPKVRLKTAHRAKTNKMKKLTPYY